jgi:hypothetical protein
MDTESTISSAIETSSVVHVCLRQPKPAAAPWILPLSDSLGLGSAPVLPEDDQFQRESLLVLLRLKTMSMPFF